MVTRRSNLIEINNIPYPYAYYPSLSQSELDKIRAIVAEEVQKALDERDEPKKAVSMEEDKYIYKVFDPLSREIKYQDRHFITVTKLVNTSSFWEPPLLMRVDEQWEIVRREPHQITARRKTYA